MKQVKWLIGLVLITGVTLGVVLVINKDETPKTSDGVSKTETVDDSSPNEATIDAGDGAPAQSEGKYVSYYEALLTDETIGTKVLFFHAPWCPQCRELEDSIKEGNIPNGVTIIKVDYDSSQSLRSKYGVTIQTSLVKIDDGGNLVKKYVAYDEPSLQSLVENLL